MKRWLTILLLCYTCYGIQAQFNTDRITSIGRNALYFDDYVLSIQYFNQVIKLKPYLAEPYLLRAIAKIQLSDYYGAINDCNKSLEFNPFQPGTYYARGYAYRSMDSLALAEQDFDKALSLSPDNRTYLVLRADVRARQENYVGATEDIDYLLRKEPTAPNLYFERGVICVHKQDTQCAKQAFTRTTELDSQNPSNWSALGMIDLMCDSADKALSDLTKAINLGSKWSGDYINRGIVFYQKHQYTSALRDYDKAVSLSPNDMQAYFNRAILRHELGDYNHALEDLNKALTLSPEQYEIYYYRGLTLLQLRQWQEACKSFDTLIIHYPYFLPAYYLAAQSQQSLGKSKEAYKYRARASDLESKKDSIVRAQLNTSVQIAGNCPASRDRRKEFSASTAQNKGESEYGSSRGTVQFQHAEVVNEGNIVLSYYSSESPSPRQTNYFHYLVENYNKNGVLPAPLHFTIHEITLTSSMVSQHFAQIEALTHRIEQNDKDCNLFFARAIEFALVQDYASAIDDCTRAIHLNGDMVLAYFCRANWRFKLLDYQRANGQLSPDYNLAFEIMFRDYDYVLTLQPDFAFAHYNKANMLCLQKDYKTAISHYTEAIGIDPDFAEAYFNRGLMYIYTDQPQQGLQDLSKSGELGIYEAYNLLTRFQ